MHVFPPCCSSLALRLALLTILNGRMGAFLCVAGLLCSSFVSISAGTHMRSPSNPLGRIGVPMVDLGNALASRTLGLKSLSRTYNALGTSEDMIRSKCFSK